jgi:hypothetical protein
MPKAANSQMNHQTFESIKSGGDVIAAGFAFGALLSWLPPLAALLTIIWTALRIYESDTVQRLLGRK